MPVNPKPKKQAPASFHVPGEFAGELFNLSPQPDGSWRGNNPFLNGSSEPNAFYLYADGTARYLPDGQPPIFYTRQQVQRRASSEIGAAKPATAHTDTIIEAEPPENLNLASRAIRPKFANQDVRQFLWAFTNGAITGAGLSVPASAFGDEDKPARRIFDATREMVLQGEEVSPGEVAAKLNQRGDDCELLSEMHEWRDLARVVVEEFSERPDDVLPDTPAAAILDFAANKLTPLKPKRAKSNEPTRDEILDTAEAVHVAPGASVQFGELNADAIPKPALTTGEKPEYESFQLRELLYPFWRSQALDTEAAHAERAEQHLGEDVLYCPELGFLHFNRGAGYWKRDDKDATITAAKLAGLAPVVRSEAAHLLKCAAALAVAARDSDARAMSRAANTLLFHVRKIEQQSFLSGAGKFLAAHRRADVEQFAPVAWKFAFKNTLFHRGEWRDLEREDFLLGTSPVHLDVEAPRGEWNQLLRRMTGDDAALQRTLQHVAAYALSGASSLRFLGWCYGPKGTGKSTFSVLLNTLLGESAVSVDTAYLAESASRERLGAKLWNKRAAFISEAGNKKIDAELLKTLSGGDPIDVKFLYKESFTASPSHALFLAANDPPRMDAYDDALKDRVMALPFVHRLGDGPPLQFNGHERVESARKDPHSDLLKGFAAWASDGLEQLYQNQQIYRAPAVDAATAKFWETTDLLTPFWETIDGEALRLGMAKNALRSTYEAWCDEEKLRPMNRNQWARACAARGLNSERRNDDRRTEIWRAI